jgi:hypothetical protein
VPDSPCCRQSTAAATACCSAVSTACVTRGKKACLTYVALLCWVWSLVRLCQHMKSSLRPSHSSAGCRQEVSPPRTRPRCTASTLLYCLQRLYHTDTSPGRPVGAACAGGSCRLLLTHQTMRTRTAYSTNTHTHTHTHTHTPRNRRHRPIFHLAFTSSLSCDCCPDLPPL